MADNMNESVSELVDTFIAVDPETESKRFQNILETQSAEEIALALESLPTDQRIERWHDVPSERRIEILVAMRSAPRVNIIKALDEQEKHSLFENCDAETLLELADSLPDRLVDLALQSMDEKQQAFYDQASKYSSDKVGHWINHNILVVSQKIQAKEALRVLRRGVPKYTEYLYVLDGQGIWKGCVRISEVVTAPENTPISSLIAEELNSLDAHIDVQQASDNLTRTNESALPVIDENGLLLGRFDIGAAVTFIRSKAESQLMAQAGMNEEEDLFGNVHKTASSRSIWLGINLLTALLAAWFIGLFEATLQEVVALAVLMPVVASMGGIAGSQTLTLIIRGLALGQITKANLKSLLDKEIRVSALTGLSWSIVIGVVAYLWFGSWIIGCIIAVAILVNMLTSAIFGVITPVILDQLKLDPALSGSVILTTATDVVGFVTFLGLGTLVFM